MTSSERGGVHWRESGRPDGPALLLSNSIASTLDMWEPQLDALNKRFRVIRYDHPGHGATPPREDTYTLADLGDVALGLLDRLGIGSASFAGVSLGALIGMHVAARAPDRVDGLALCSTPPVFTSRRMWLNQATAAREHGTNEIVSETVERWFTAHFRQHHAAETASFATTIANTDDESYARCCEVIAGADLRRDLDSITAPTLITAGVEDPVAPPSHAAAIAEGIGDNARVEVLPHAAHMVGVEQPEEITRLLVEALSR